MTRYCCPECKDHIMLDDDLKCVFCEGQYKWVSGDKENHYIEKDE